MGDTCQVCEGLVLDGVCQNCGKKIKVTKECKEVVHERLGGKGYSRSAMKSSIHPPSRKSSGDWEDSDRGEGNKAKRRAGEKVKAKSPTYTAWVKNKNVEEGFKTQYGKKGKLSKTDAPGSRHDHTHDVDPKMADHVPNKKVRKSSKAETRANVLKFDMKKEEVVSEAERKLADRLQRKRELYKKTTKKALEYARREGEAAGHARYRMSSISREMDGIRAKMKKEG